MKILNAQRALRNDIAERYYEKNKEYIDDENGYINVDSKIKYKKLLALGDTPSAKDINDIISYNLPSTYSCDECDTYNCEDIVRFGREDHENVFDICFDCLKKARVKQREHYGKEWRELLEWKEELIWMQDETAEKKEPLINKILERERFFDEL